MYFVHSGHKKKKHAFLIKLLCSFLKLITVIYNGKISKEEMIEKACLAGDRLFVYDPSSSVRWYRRFEPVIKQLKIGDSLLVLCRVFAIPVALLIGHSLHF